MSEAMQVLSGLYRRAHGRDAEGEDAVLIWAAEQLALLFEGVEMEAAAPPERPAVGEWALSGFDAQMAQVNEDAKR